MSEKIPHSIATEEALLGAVLINGGVLDLIDLEAGEFFIHRHQWVWEACKTAHQNGGLDFRTVTNELENMERLADVGGASFLNELVGSTPSSLNATSYAKIIRGHANRRKGIALANEIVVAAYNEKQDFDTSQFIDRLVDASKVSRGATPIKEHASDFYDLVEDRTNDPLSAYGIPTGFIDFDSITDGLHRTQMLLIVGDPGVGKSMFAMQLGEQVAEGAKLAGAIYSMEMASRYFMARRLSVRSKIEVSSMMRGSLEPDEWSRFAHEIGAISELPIFISDYSGWTLAGLRADLTRLKVQNDIGWVVIDYLGLIQNHGYKNTWDEVAYKSRGLMKIFKDLDIAGVAIHTLTKSGRDRPEFTLTALEGKGIDYDADTVFFMQENKEQENIVHFIPGKQRHAPKETIFSMVRNPNYPFFADVTLEWKDDWKQKSIERTAP